ncbi:MAG: 6-phosphofructokinase [Deltaproteobacteria bacterium]|nr:6-phosphofructokinase [Deltaproteobacteria bacterium]
MKKVGLLTGGGDCPGLNAAIRAVVRKATSVNWEVLGIKNGWKGLIEGNVEPLTKYSVSGILPKGGTILGTSRTNPFKDYENTQKLLDNFKRYELNGIIAIGGEDTLGVAMRLYKEYSIPVIGIPKTIDNDIAGTDLTFGFDTAVSIVTESIDRLHSTAESHHRIMVVEVMGRHAGWIATISGIAGGADIILVPETPFDINNVCNILTKRHEKGKHFSIVVVAEGATPKGSEIVITQSNQKDEFGHVRLGGIGSVLAQEIEKRTGIETRVTILGYIQRGGTPTAFDRVLATRYGVLAMELMAKGEVGKMVALRGNKVIAIDLDKDAVKPKTLDMELYKVAELFFG